MKNSVLIIVLLMFGLVSFSQQKKNKNEKIDFQVFGNCGMCEKRIEKAAYSVKGVKNADWDNEKQRIYLIFDANKCNVNDVATAIAKVGHDTELKKATEEDYENLHGCCQYERKE